MQPILVIGCNSLELTPSGIRVLDQSGTTTISWRDVTAAALAGKDRETLPMHEEIGAQSGPAMLPPAGMSGPELPWAGVYGNLMKMFELQETHDPLLIVHRAGIVHALIERIGPQHDALLAGLRANLGKRWLGEDFTSQQLKQRFEPESSGCSLRTCGCVTVLLGGVTLLWIGGLLGVAVLAIPGATASVFLEALLHGDWEAALIAAAALVVIVLVYLGGKKVAGYIATIFRGRFG